MTTVSGSGVVAPSESVSLGLVGWIAKSLSGSPEVPARVARSSMLLLLLLEISRLLPVEALLLLLLTSLRLTPRFSFA